MSTATKPVEQIERVVIRFAGDSGDGMQLTGSQLTATSALVGNDIATFPDFPAEIRAPAGTLPGVSGFQVHIGQSDIRTPGDRPDVLVAMNPAALKVCLPDMEDGTTIVVNRDEFTTQKLKRATWTSNPLEDDTLSRYRVVNVPLTSLTVNALDDVPELAELNKASKERCRNFFALGMMYWLFDRPTEPTIQWLESKFKKKPILAEANARVLKAGYFYADTVELFTHVKRIAPATHMAAGEYRQVTGNQALAYGLVAASIQSGVPLFYGSYPITPASDILHALANLKDYGVLTFQAEDEIAGCGAALGAAYAGSIGVTGTSGPGVCLKSEMMGLAVMTELPLIVINVQRGGPSTGMPTKTEQADLLQAMYGRNGESPLIVIAPSTPAGCFEMAYEAVRLATKFMTPVVLLSDGYLANGAEPWRIPDEDELAPIDARHHRETGDFEPYQRNEHLARPWVSLGTEGLEHRIGGLEKAETTGDVNMQPDNHERMVELRAEKVAGVADDIPPLDVIEGPDRGELLVLGWGSTYGAIHMAVTEWNQNHERPVANAHLHYLNPFPKNMAELLERFDKVLIPELNKGQLALLLRGRFGANIAELHKVQGRPFTIAELHHAFREHLDGVEA